MEIKMKQVFTAITIHQPWASAIALGKKRYETRSWAVRHRGRIAIHAGKNTDGLYLSQGLMGVDGDRLPLGAVIAIVDLTGCIKMDDDLISRQPDLELKLGRWKSDRYAWKLENVQAIDPVYCLGKQGLWKVNLRSLSYLEN